MLESFVWDFRYAFRSLRRNPGFTAVATLSLALGIGANTAIFTFVNAALLRPLPYPEADRIVALQQRPLRGTGSTYVHPRSFVPWRDHAQSFEALAMAQAIPVNTQGEDGAEQIRSLWTTPELFRVFAVAPLLGRTFADENGKADLASIVLSHSYWRRRFGADPNVVGKTMPVGRGAAVIVGVMPAGFRVGSLDVDVYSPLPLERSRPEAVGSRSFLCFGRLRPGVTMAAVQAEMDVIAGQVGRDDKVEREFGVVVSGLRDYLVRDSRLVLFVMLGVVAFVLLIACANLAGLLLTRGIGRQCEMALRAALGAGRWRIAQQLVSESLALSGIGGALGLLLGWGASRALIFLARDAVAFGQMADVRLDARVITFTAALALLTGVLFGLAPAWRGSAMKLEVRSAGVSRGQNRLRSALVVAEVALAVVLLVGAGLLLRTFSRLMEVKLGFQPEQALTMRTLVTGSPAERSALTERILDRVETLPGVRAAGTIQFLPLSGMTNHGEFHFVGRPLPSDPSATASDVSTVSRGYFAAMGIEMLRGRPFGRDDRMDSPRVAVVNQAFVRKYSPDEDPLGRVILGDWANPKPTEIVGVVGDIRHNGLTVEPQPTVFLAQAQVPGYITYLVVRTAERSGPLIAAIRHEVRQVDPKQPITDVQTMQQYVSTALARPRLYADLLGTFSGLALLLAAIGLYGLLAYAVSRRTHEIGIRMALGAQPAEVLRATLGQGARLAALGLVLGTGGAVALTRVVSQFLDGVSAEDPVTYAGVAGLLGAVALLAVYLPARRAAAVDPIVALRYE